MRRANSQRHADRRTEILDAACRCFVRSGFHQASMHDICGEAGMSPGNLYRYFPSKEAIIAGISERDRSEVAESFAEVRDAPDFFAALAGLARTHLIERTVEEVGLCAEIMAESRRNPEVARLYRELERSIKADLAGMLRHAAERGEIRADMNFDAVAAVLMALADGMSWRRAVDPEFDAEYALPLVLQMVGGLLRAPASVSEASR
jgi:AcrR family transcriptional regulator